MCRSRPQSVQRLSGFHAGVLASRKVGLRQSGGMGRYQCTSVDPALAARSFGNTDNDPDPSEKAIPQGEGGACLPLLTALRQDLPPREVCGPTRLVGPASTIQNVAGRSARERSPQSIAHNAVSRGSEARRSASPPWLLTKAARGGLGSAT